MLGGPSSGTAGRYRVRSCPGRLTGGPNYDLSDVCVGGRIDQWVVAEFADLGRAGKADLPAIAISRSS